VEEAVKTVWREIRYGLRMLGKNPVYACIVILTIAIVIGANTGLFPYLETMILRNVESEAKQLVVIAERKSDGPASLSFSYPMYVGLRGNNETPRAINGRGGSPRNLDYVWGSERVRGEFVSGNYFAVLGAHSWIGRLICESDEQSIDGRAVAVIGYDFWKNYFGGDPSVVNQSISINGHRVTVIGVTPPGFHGSGAEILLPLSTNAIFHPSPGNRMRNHNEQVTMLKASLALAARVRCAATISESGPNERPRAFGKTEPLRFDRSC
jgi:hypothetical protein